MEAIMVAEQQYFRTRLREQHSELTAERDALARELEVQRRKVKKYKSRAVQSSKVKDIDPCCEQDLEEVNWALDVIVSNKEGSSLFLLLSLLLYIASYHGEDRM